MRRWFANIFLKLSDALSPKRLDQIAVLNGTEAGLRKALASYKEQFEEYRPKGSWTATPEWTPDDAACLQGFLKTAAGQALQRRFTSIAASVAIEGCKDVMHTAHSAGCAFGWTEALRWFLSLSRVARVEATKDEQVPEGEEQLLERLSP